MPNPSLPAVDQTRKGGRVILWTLAGKPAWRVWRGGHTAAHWLLCEAIRMVA